MTWHVALDYSGREAVLALENEQHEIISDQHLFSMRDGSSLLPWIISFLNQHKILLSEITEWRLGIGPGSFTSLRIASALLQGIVEGQPHSTLLGIPSAFGVPALPKPPQKGDSVAVLYDGRNHELLFYGLKWDETENWVHNQDSGVIKVTEADMLGERYSCFCALSSQRPAIPEQIKDKPVYFSEQLNIIALLKNPHTQSAVDLIYLRPAAFTEPQKIRDIK